MNAGDANAQANLGTALVQLRRLDEVGLHYEAALRFDPTNQPASETLQQLEQLTTQTPH